MKIPVYAVRAVFAEAQPGVYERMWRIRADGRAVFAWEDDVPGLDRLKALGAGTEVLMGLSPLVDGTFRLHWLHTPEGEHFVSRRSPARARQDRDAALRGETGICPPLKDLGPVPDPDAGAEQSFIAELERAPDPEKPATLYRAEGNALRIKAASRLRLMPKGRMDPYVSYAFTCAGRQVHFTFSSEKIVPENSHPFFLAEGDRVRAVVGEDEETIQAVLNLEDGCRYLRTVGAYASWRWVRQQIRNALRVSACIVAAALAGVLFAGMTYHVFLGAVGVAAFLGGILAAGACLENYLGRRYGRGRADLLRVLDVLEVTADRDNIPYVHILEARYPAGRWM